MMKRILIVLVLLCTTIAQSQSKFFEDEVVQISKKIDKITKQQKDSLKQKVKIINLKLERNEISNEMAGNLKKEASQYHANRIEELISIQEQKLQQLVQDKTNGKIASNSSDYEEDVLTIGKSTFRFKIFKNDSIRKMRRRKRRTTTQFVFALGVNNVLVNHNLESLNTSNYKFWQSHFYELGLSWKTRLSKEPSKLYFKYGFSFLWNNLRAKNNKFHVLNGNTTNLAVNPIALSESRLRHVQMTFPMYLEVDFSKNKKYSDGKIGDRTHKNFRFGVGGFLGFKLGTRQYLEYTSPTGIRVEEVQENSFNTNTLNYGLGAYFSYKGVGLYTKYDLNSLFNDTDIRNISIGVRFDLLELSL